MTRAWFAFSLVLAASGSVEALLLDPPAGPIAGVLGAIALAATLLLVPSRPPVGAALVVAATLAVALTDAHPHDGLTPVAIIMLAAVGAGLRTPPERTAMLTMAVLGVGALVALAYAYRDPDPTLRAFPFFVAFLGASFALGHQLRRRARERDDLQGRRHALEQERAAQVAGAVSRERERIATELHAIIAISVDRVANGARRADEQLNADPDAAVATLREVRGAASAALTETRRLLGVLRAHEPEYAPQPDIAALVARGLDVRLGPGVEPLALPAGVELTVVRLIEDAVAAVDEVRRQAVRVEVDRDDDGVAFAVDVGATSAPWAAGDPVLAAMHERARVFGGRVWPTAVDGRCVLRGHLPLPAVVA